MLIMLSSVAYMSVRFLSFLLIQTSSKSSLEGSTWYLSFGSFWTGIKGVPCVLFFSMASLSYAHDA